MADQAQNSATNAFGVTQLRGAAAQGITAVKDMFLDAGIELTEETNNIITSQMFPGGALNSQFDIAAFWQDTFGKARQQSGKIELMDPTTWLAPLNNMWDMASNMSNGIGGMIQGVLSQIAGLFGLELGGNTETTETAEVKNYIDESLPQTPVTSVTAPAPAPTVQTAATTTAPVGLEGRQNLSGTQFAPSAAAPATTEEEAPTPAPAPGENA